LAGYLSDVLIPFAVALLLAYLTNPLVSLIQKKFSNRVAAVFISLLLIIVLYFIFLLLDYEAVRGWKELVPPAYRESVGGLVDDFESAMSNYFRGQAAVASICGVLFAIGFALIGLPLGILLGLFIGLLNMVPYLQIIGLIPAGLLAIMHAVQSGVNVWMVLGFTGLVFVVVQIIQEVILVPKIMGKVTGLNPAMIMLSLSIWGKLLGLLGMIIALPVTYLLLVYYRRLINSAPSIANSSESPSNH
jgi:predicted PurR-regulated permease PerM